MNKTMKITTKPQNQQSQLQGGHVSHKTPDGIFMFSKSTPPVCQNQRNQIKRKQKPMTVRRKSLPPSPTMVRRKTPPPSPTMVRRKTPPPSPTMVRRKNPPPSPKKPRPKPNQKLQTKATKKIRSMKHQRKIVQENDNNLSTIKRKRKFVHEYVNLSFKRFKFVELPDTEPPPAPTLHQLPSQLPDFAKESKLPLHVGLPPSQVPITLGAGTFGPYRRSYYKKKPRTKFKKK